MTSRRVFLSRSLRAGVSVALVPLVASFDRFVPRDDRLRDAERLPDLPLGERVERLGSRVGRGLDGRLRVDLSGFTDTDLVVPNDDFFIRTFAPDRIDFDLPWLVDVDDATGRSHREPVESIRNMSRPLGVHLLECSGNHGSFGLLSAAEWRGVPLLEWLDHHEMEGDRWMITGRDAHSSRSVHSTRGAAWVFTRAQLETSGAFLATGMNGAVLPRDHGYPVRLVVPGWYGCCCIKWVGSVQAVSDRQRATGQMREFASRTHQGGRPSLARDYRPAEIDLTAMPIRVERYRLADGSLLHRVVGVIWGGERTTDRLMIRFNSADPVPVTSLDHRTNATWTLWSHDWRPARRGRYRITMVVDDPDIRTRRLDSRFYNRRVEIARTS